MKKYGGFLKRLLAWIIDSLLYYVIAGMIGVDNTTVQFLLFVLWTAYFVWMTGMYGATVGKMIMKLKVTKDNGTKVSYSDALLRELASYLSFFVFGLGYLSIMWDEKKQSWHDKIAKTVVVQTN